MGKNPLRFGGICAIKHTMFTGIITHSATLASITSVDTGMRARFDVAFDVLPAVGASIACSGCCLTALEVDHDGFSADLSPETLDKTTAQDWRVGDVVNIERSLKIGDELGGHIVSGHVDGVARLDAITQQGAYWALRLTAPHSLSRYIAQKGSVTLDGISLTVNDVAGDCFTVMIIPHTWQETSLRNRKVGDRLNLEVDVMARYAARLADFTPSNAQGEAA